MAPRAGHLYVSCRRQLSWLCILVSSGFSLCVRHVYSQNAVQNSIQGPDNRETSQGEHGHLLGDWGGERPRLQRHGVTFDFQYVADHLSNVEGEKSERFVSWNRVRATVDIDLGALTGLRDWHFHATGVWQAGGNLGAYIGLLSGPSSLPSHSTWRLDSWWFEKRWLDEQVTARVGQFAGQDFYGVQHYAASFVLEPMGHALGNLRTTFESFDPPSTPAGCRQRREPSGILGPVSVRCRLQPREVHDCARWGTSERVGAG
jgi:porin